MGKVSVIIIDSDGKYLLPLEFRFMEALNDNLDITLISNRDYFREYFSEPKTANVLIVSEQFYTPEILKHDIEKVFVLGEKNESAYVDDDGTIHLYKYRSVDSIYSIIMQLVPSVASSQRINKETKIVAVASASGGVGKTLISVGIAAEMAKRDNNVLYLNAAEINSFQHMICDKTPLPRDIGISLLDREHIYDSLSGLLRKELFTYLPPMPGALMSYSETIEMYADFIAKAKVRGEYDIIIVDMETSLNECKTKILEMADKVLLLLNNTSASLNATEQFMRNIGKTGDRFVFICNRTDVPLKNDMCVGFNVDEYVSEIENVEEMTLKELSESEDIIKITYLAE